MTSGPILLPAPVATDSLALGQLLADPLNPDSKSFISSTSLAVKAPSFQARYKDVISHDDQGRFVSSLSGQSVSPQSNLLLLQADQMTYTSLNSPTAAFEALRRDTNTQSFLRRAALRNQPLYYVTGIQKLKNPTFKRAVIKEGSIAEAPASPDPKIRLPMHVRRDSAMDMEESINDAVFAVELRKVLCHIGSAEEPHSLEDIGYDWSYHWLDREAEIQLSIGLGKALDAAELRALAGIVSDDDFTDGSYDSDNSDDGLAGF